MQVLNVNGLKKSFGADELLHGISFAVDEKDKIGLIGVNGAGKSTLFRILTGETEYDEGSIGLARGAEIGYMEQQADYTSDSTVLEEILKAFAPLEAMEAELARLAALIDGGAGDEARINEQHRLREKFEREGGLTFRARARSTLLGLGFEEKELSMPVRNLSGGQRTRVELASILLSEKKLLLLDEPTNHLDIDAVAWLENFLRSYGGAFIVISHDRYFLDRVTTSTMEIENGRLIRYSGGYSQYAEKKAAAREAAEHRYKNLTREIRRVEGIVSNQRRWNRERNIRTAESKLKQIERMKKELEKPDADPESIHFEFSAREGGANEVLEVKGVEKSFGGKMLFSGVDMLIKNGERVFLLGPNGCGKTTLLNIIMHRTAPDRGRVRLGENIVPAYYEQTQRELISSKRIIDEVWDACPKMTQTEVRCALAAFLFKGETVTRELNRLSGGERARVALLKLMLSEANLLVLDEPTNHLDINSAEALEEAIADYPGTVLCVSHDRYFINRLADRICYLDAEGCASFEGDYDGFIESLPERKPEETVKKPPSLNAVSYREKKERQSLLRRTQGRISRVEEEIARSEAAIEKLEGRLCLPEVAGDRSRLLELSGELDHMRGELDGLYSQWEELSSSLEELTAEEL